MFAHKAPQRTGVGVKAAAGGKTDDDTNSFAVIEIIGGALG